MTVNKRNLMKHLAYAIGTIAFVLFLLKSICNDIDERVGETSERDKERNAEILRDMAERGMSGRITKVETEKPMPVRRANSDYESVGLPKVQVDFRNLLMANRAAVTQVLGDPKERDDTDRTETFTLGKKSTVAIGYQDGLVSYARIAVSGAIHPDDIQEWAHLGDGDYVDNRGVIWRVSNYDMGTKSAPYMTFYVITSELPSIEFNAKKILGKNKSQVTKALKRDFYTIEGGPTYYGRKFDVTISAQFSREDTKVSMLNVTFSEGIKAKEQVKELLDWTGVKPVDGEQRINGIRYGITTSGHGVNFQRLYGKYSKRELGKVMGR